MITFVLSNWGQKIIILQNRIGVNLLIINANPFLYYQGYLYDAAAKSSFECKPNLLKFLFG